MFISAHILWESGLIYSRFICMSELQSYYLFADKFGRPAKGNDKGKVEGLVGYARRSGIIGMANRVS
jgi:transposase